MSKPAMIYGSNLASANIHSFAIILTDINHVFDTIQCPLEAPPFPTGYRITDTSHTVHHIKYRFYTVLKQQGWYWETFSSRMYIQIIQVGAVVCNYVRLLGKLYFKFFFFFVYYSHFRFYNINTQTSNCRTTLTLERYCEKRIYAKGSDDKFELTIQTLFIIQ